MFCGNFALSMNCYSQVIVVEKDGEELAEDSCAVLTESSPTSENQDQEVIVEALKSICNILLHNETGQVSPWCSFFVQRKIFLTYFNL